MLHNAKSHTNIKQKNYDAETQIHEIHEMNM